jgi:predicted molibdopterin-dependent oxidoreductase YjgC
MGAPLGLASPVTINKEIATVAPAYEDVTWDALEWEHRDGVVTPIHGAQAINHIPVALQGSKAPKAQLTLHVARVMYDDGVRLRHSPSSHVLARGSVVHINPADAPKIGAQEGRVVKVVTRSGEGEFVVVLDDRTPAGVVYVPFNQPGAVSLGTDPVVRVTAVNE